MAKSKSSPASTRRGAARKGRARRHPAGPDRGSGGRASGSGRPRQSHKLLIYGNHAVQAALANPARRSHRLLLTAEARQREGALLQDLLSRRNPAPPLVTVGRQDLDQLLPGAVHQGMALEAEPLTPPSLHEFLRGLEPGPALIVVLDQVTDPQNVGAILRSCAVFGAAALLAPERHAAPESGTLAKSASGALEIVPYLREVNLARCLDQLKDAGFWAIGLAGEAPQRLPDYDPPDRIALCMGAEGSGLRRLTRERCDLLLSLPAAGRFRDLNVSNAAAVALYALSKEGHRRQR